MKVAELFKALGDSTRLEILERLSTGKIYTLTTLSKGLEISRQGARKHLQILEDANLAVLKVEGRDTYVLLNKKSFEIGKKFIAKLESQWEERLNSLKNFVENK